MDSVPNVMNTVHPNLPKARHSFTLHVYITTIQSTSQTALCVLSPPFSLALSAVVVSARRPDVVALETHKV